MKLLTSFDVLRPSLLAQKAFHAHGLEAKLEQLREEMSEAIAAISHWKRGRAGALDEVAEELADVLIVAEQLMVVLDDDVSRWLALKRQALFAKHIHVNAEDA